MFGIKKAQIEAREDIGALVRALALVTESFDQVLKEHGLA